MNAAKALLCPKQEEWWFHRILDWAFVLTIQWRASICDGNLQ